MSANLQWIQGQPINRFKCIIQCISIKFIPCCPVQTTLTLTCTHFFGSLRLPEKFHLGATLLHFDPWHWSSYVHSRDSEFGNLRSLWLIWKEWNAGNKWVRHGNLPWLQFAAGLAFHWQTNGVFPLQIKMKVNFICPLPPYNFFCHKCCYIQRIMMHGCIQIYKSIITKMTGNFCIVDTTYLGSFDVWQIYWVHYRGLERGSPRNICWLGRRDEWGGGSQSHQMGEDLYCWRGNLFLVDHYQSVIEINLNFFSSNNDCMKNYLVGKCEIQQQFT